MSSAVRLIEAPDLANKLWRQFYQVSPVVLVTTCNHAGRLNVAPKTQVTRIGRGPLIGFGCTPAHHTYQYIKEMNEFVIGYPAPNLLKNVAHCRRGFAASVVDEITAAGLTPVASKAVRPPRVSECPVSLECKLVEIRDYGGFSFIVGQAVLAWIDEDRLVCSDRMAQEQLSRFPLLAYIYPDNYATIEQAERFPADMA